MQLLSLGLLNDCVLRGVRFPFDSSTLCAGDTSDPLSLRLDRVLRLFLRVPQAWALPVQPLWISLDLMGLSSGAYGEAERSDCSKDFWLLITAIWTGTQQALPRIITESVD